MFKFISLLIASKKNLIASKKNLIASKKNLIEENKRLKDELEIWVNADGHPLTEYIKGYHDGLKGRDHTLNIPTLNDIIK